MRYKPTGGGKCDTGKYSTIQGVENAGIGKAGNEKYGTQHVK